MDSGSTILLGVFLFFFLIIITLILAIKYANIKPEKSSNKNYFEQIIEKLSGLNANQDKINNAKQNLFNQINELWDPIEKLNVELIKESAAKIEVKIEELKKDPGQINRHLLMIAMLGFLISSVVIYITYVTEILFAKNGIQIPAIVLSLFFSIFFAVRAYYILLTKDLIKLEIAKRKNWIYNPEHDKTKYNKLIEYFPEVFTKGNQNQYIEDQFWGIINSNNSNHYFYSGVFYYEIVSGSGKNRKVTKYTNHYFIFPLKKDINSRFNLYPENVVSIIKNWFTKKEINVESNKFNETFAFTYNGKKDEKALEIVKTITPAMQEKLIKLYEQKGGAEILFARTVVVFLFNKDIIENIKTDFRKDSDINKEDLELIDSKLNELIKISQEMSKYLD